MDKHCSFAHKVVFIYRNIPIATLKPYPFFNFFKPEVVYKINFLHDGFYFMKAIISFAQNLQKKIYLGRSFQVYNILLIIVIIIHKLIHL